MGGLVRLHHGVVLGCVCTRVIATASHSQLADTIKPQPGETGARGLRRQGANPSPTFRGAIPFPGCHLVPCFLLCINWQAVDPLPGFPWGFALDEVGGVHEVTLGLRGV